MFRRGSQSDVLEPVLDVEFELLPECKAFTEPELLPEVVDVAVLENCSIWRWRRAWLRMRSWL